MLKRMMLINSANFQFADIDLSKEIFFVGDNASGKTTSTRALHFLYNSDGQKLGIPSGKDSFSKHYFPNDDSYIIYVFETFFIFTYSRNNAIKRWFSKQEFNIESIIKDGELEDFKNISKYIKSASLSYKPSTIDEYTSILYGNSRKYMDFTIAKIENYKVFLEVFNMIFNIDKAIVTASDIKKAIQKSLDRKDETLNIDYEDFIRKLNEFARSYHFFKMFDSNRSNLKKALLLKSELQNIERKSSLTSKAINYRYTFEIDEFNKHQKSIELINELIKKHNSRLKSIHRLYRKFDDRVSIKIDLLRKEIIKLEISKEKFDPIDISENTISANKYESIKEALDNKMVSLFNLKKSQTSTQEVIENEIKQIKHKIKIHIPNEMKEAVYKLSEIEKSTHENELLEIQKEFDLLEDTIREKIRDVGYEIDRLNDAKNSIDLEVLREQNEIKQKFILEINPLQSQKVGLTQSVQNLELKKIELEKEKRLLDIKIEEHEDKYKKIRRANARILASKRSVFNANILKARAILNPKTDSFHEFLSNEVDGWEEDIYPVIDKSLLLMSCSELKPQIIDEKSPIGFKIDSTTLLTLPTKDEALRIIEQNRSEKYTLLLTSKEIYKSEIAKLNEIKNRLTAEIESLKQEINNLIDDKALSIAEIEKISKDIQEEEEKLKATLEIVVKESSDKRESITQSIDSKSSDIKTFEDDLKNLAKEKKDTTDKVTQKRDFNIDIIKKQELQKANKEIIKQNTLIEKLSQEMVSLDQNDLIQKLSDEITKLETEIKISSNAIRFLEEYEDEKESIKQLPSREIVFNKYKKIYEDRKLLIRRVEELTREKLLRETSKKQDFEEKLKKYDTGIKKVQSQSIDISEEKIESYEFLTDLIDTYEDQARAYRNEKSKFRELIDKLKRLETNSIIELNFDMENFGEAKSIDELDSIIDSLDELSSFEKNKYESEKKRSHNNFDTFIRLTIPSKIQSFDDLESEFEKAKNSINRTLSHANFGVIRDIKLITDSSKKRADSIASLLQELSKKVQDTVGLYSNKSLFYTDISKSVGNIVDIQTILEEIRKKGSKGTINLFDTIDLSISYIENGKKVDNKLNIKDESSSGGNILLKVAIAMSILNRYAKKTSSETPFFLIIDEVSKLQSKNQDLIRKYINENGFKTLFITPDPAYPDPARAIYYTFKNIQEEDETLEIRQMNII